MAPQFCSGKKIVFRNPYKIKLVLTARNAGVAQTSLGVTYLSLMKSMKTHTCALYVHHRHICAWPKQLTFCISLFGESQTLTFEKYDPSPQQTTKYWICGVLGVHEYASGENIKLRVWFIFKNVRLTHCNLTRTITQNYDSAAKMRSQKCLCG